MPWTPRLYDWVQTLFGEGKVVRLFENRIRVRIPSRKNVELNFTLKELDPLDEGEEKDEVPQATEAPQPVKDDSSNKGGHVASPNHGPELRTLEALRFGLVPTFSLDVLTIGYAKLEAWVLRHLPHMNDGRPCMSEVVGPFGAGKSHTMAVVRHVANKARYLTSRVEVDGLNVSLSDPQKLLAEIWRNVRIPDKPVVTPLLDLYLDAIGKGQPAPSVAPTGIDRIHDNYCAVRAVKKGDLIDEYDVILNSILSCNREFRPSEVQREIARRMYAGWDFKIRPPLAQRVAERPWDCLESLIGNAAVAQLAGYRGLVVTIDEFEVEHNLPESMWERVEDLVDVLRDYFLKKLEHKAYPLALFFTSVPQDEDVGEPLLDHIVQDDHDKPFELKSISARQRLQLAEAIHTLYSKTYGLEDPFDLQLSQAVYRRSKGTDYDDGSLIRAFIKRYIAELDCRYGPPNGTN